MHLLLLGHGAAAIERTVREWAADVHLDAFVAFDAATLGWTRAASLPRPAAGPRFIRIDHLDRAFPNRQVNDIRLVLTQPGYVMQTLLDRLDAGDRIVATASRSALERDAPEVLARTGPWRAFDIVEDRAAPTVEATRLADTATVETRLAQAFSLESPVERLAICRALHERVPASAAAALALGSAARECQELDLAHAAFEAALRVAPDWAAVHYESAKCWLASEDLERARAGFERAAALMPSFAAAFSNLGAVRGELGDREGALTAFAEALRVDPDNVTILSNVGVAQREGGALAESEAALHRVTSLAPGFAFGHYNLGHTHFLAGNYAGALAAYEEGQRRDPERNRRQGCRLALVRFALGETDRALEELRGHADAAPFDEREDLLLEAYEIAEALIAAHPALDRDHSFLTKIAAALTV